MLSRHAFETTFRCGICLETPQQFVVSSKCAHRFCKLCIQKSLLKGFAKCPECGCHISSRRDFHVDAGFNNLFDAYRNATYKETNNIGTQTDEQELRILTFRPLRGSGETLKTKVRDRHVKGEKAKGI